MLKWFIFMGQMTADHFIYTKMELSSKDRILFRHGGRNTEKWHNTFSIPYIVNDNFNNVFCQKN